MVSRLGGRQPPSRNSWKATEKYDKNLASDLLGWPLENSRKLTESKLQTFKFFRSCWESKPSPPLYGTVSYRQQVSDVWNLVANRSAAWLALSGASAGGLCFLSPTWVFPRWCLQALSGARWISLASFSVCERDDHQEPQQVPQPGEEGRLSHVTDQHDCGVLTA